MNCKRAIERRHVSLFMAMVLPFFRQNVTVWPVEANQPVGLSAHLSLPFSVRSEAVPPNRVWAPSRDATTFPRAPSFVNDELNMQSVWWVRSCRRAHCPLALHRSRSFRIPFTLSVRSQLRGWWLRGFMGKGGVPTNTKHFYSSYYRCALIVYPSKLSCYVSFTIFFCLENGYPYVHVIYLSGMWIKTQILI